MAAPKALVRSTAAGCRVLHRPLHLESNMSARQTATVGTSVSVCRCVCCYIVCLVMDSCQWKERAERGAGWISMFALARRQKTPLFFSAGDNK